MNWVVSDNVILFEVSGMERKGAMREEKKRMNEGAGGFTLVELIVVLVILSILAAVAVPAVTGFIDDGKAKECQTQMEALAADIATAKMSYEVGDETGGTFDIGTYIASAGELGKCPSGGEYSVDTTDASQMVLTCSLHGETAIPNSGKFSVTVAAPIPEVPSPAPETSTPMPDNTGKNPDSSPKPDHTYSAKIGPGPLDLEVGGAPGNLTVTVTETDENGNTVPVDPSRVTVEWIYPENVSVSDPENGMDASVKAEHEGAGQIHCEVTITETDSSTTTVTSDFVDVTVSEPKPKLHLEVLPEIEVKKDESAKIEAGVYDEKNELYTGGGVTVTYESENSDVVEVDPVTGKVSGKVPNGECNVTVTLKDEAGNVLDEKKVPVKVKPEEEPQSQPRVTLEVTPGSIDDLKAGESKELTASVTEEGLDGKGNVNYQYEWKTSDSNITVTPSADGKTATVTGVSAGETPSTVTCTVTVTYTENGETKTVQDTKNIPVTVTEPRPEPGITVTTDPDSIADLEAGGNRDVTATVTPQGLDGKSGVTYEYKWESSDSNVAIVTGGGATVRVTGNSNGTCNVTCTVTATYTDEEGTHTLTETKTIPVTVTGAESEFGLVVPPVTVKEGEDGQLDPSVTGGSGNYEYKFENLTPDIIEVDENTGKVTGGKAGEGQGKVRVTVTDTVTGKTKSVDVEVNVTKGGLFDPHTFYFWTTDAASIELQNDEEFKKILDQLPLGTWSLVSGDVSDYHFADGVVKLHPVHYMDGTDESCATDFVLRYTTTDGITDELMVKVGFVIGSIQAPYEIPNNGSEAIFTVRPDPPYTTDVPFTWEIKPTQDSEAEVEWSYANEKHTQIKVKKSPDGQCKFEARAYTTRQKTGERVESGWSTLTVEKKKAITNVTLSPSPLNLEVGQTATLTVTPECDSSVDMSKVKYSFSSESGEVANVDYPGQQRSENAATVTGKNAGNTKIRVDVFYGVDWMAYAQCDVTVLKEGEVFIDAKKFKANSWDSFKASVEASTSDNSYKINQNKNKDGQDSPLYYDADGQLYVAIGTGKSYKRTENKGKEVIESTSFADYISKGKNYADEEFAPIAMPVKVSDTVKWSELGNNDKIYNIGEIVKVIRDDRGGEVEYYITNVKTDRNRDQSDIKTAEHEGWWRLDILP